MSKSSLPSDLTPNQVSVDSTLTGNGTAATPLSAIGGSGFTAGSIPFSNGLKFIQDNTKLFWDNTNKKLKISGNPNAIGPAIELGDTSGDAGSRNWEIVNSNGALPYGTFAISNSTAPGGASNENPRLTIDNNGNLGIGTSIVNPFANVHIYGSSVSNNVGILFENELTEKAYFGITTGGGPYIQIYGNSKLFDIYDVNGTVLQRTSISGNFGFLNVLTLPGADTFYPGYYNMRMGPAASLFWEAGGNLAIFLNGLYLGSSGDWRYTTKDIPGSAIQLSTNGIQGYCGDTLTHSAGDIATLAQFLDIKGSSLLTLMGASNTVHIGPNHGSPTLSAMYLHNLYNDYDYFVTAGAGTHLYFNRPTGYGIVFQEGGNFDLGQGQINLWPSTSNYITSFMLGNVGIGGNNPAYKLEVFDLTGAGNAIVNCNNNGVNSQIQSANSGSYLNSDYSRPWIMQVNGNPILNLLASGVVNMPSLPGASTGLSTGDLWRDGSGYVRIV